MPMVPNAMGVYLLWIPLIGVGMESITPPKSGRAPGWDAGIAVALAQPAPAG